MNRRTFIKRSVVGGVGVAVGLLCVPSGITYRVCRTCAAIGANTWAPPIHRPTYRFDDLPGKRRVEDMVRPLSPSRARLLDSSEFKLRLDAFAAKQTCVCGLKGLRYIPSGAIEDITIIGGILCSHIMHVTGCGLDHTMWLLPWPAIELALRHDTRCPECGVAWPAKHSKFEDVLYANRDDATERYNNHLRLHS